MLLPYWELIWYMKRQWVCTCNHFQERRSFLSKNRTKAFKLFKLKRLSAHLVQDKELLTTACEVSKGVSKTSSVQSVTIPHNSQYWKARKKTVNTLGAFWVRIPIHQTWRSAFYHPLQPCRHFVSFLWQLNPRPACRVILRLILGDRSLWQEA